MSPSDLSLFTTRYMPRPVKEMSYIPMIIYIHSTIQQHFLVGCGLTYSFLCSPARAKTSPASSNSTAKPRKKTDSFSTKKRGPNETRRSFRPRGPRFGWEDDVPRRLRHTRLAFRYVCREVRAKNARVPIRQRFSGRAKRRHPFAKGDLRFKIPQPISRLEPLFRVYLEGMNHYLR